GTYDRFRDRLMIPICDPTGNVLGFGARDLSADGKGGAKYINTPKTELYDKSRVLFGIDHARDPIRQSKHAIIMEGYTDVMMAHQFGVANAVAVCGTAFTEGHLQLLRQADRLTLLFDGDTPGMTAAERALEQLVAKEVQASIVVLPDGLDPADYLQQRGAEAFMAELEHGLGAVEFKLSAVRRRHDFDNPVEHAHAAEECIQLMRAAQSPVFREALLHKFAAGLGLREDTLRRQMNDEDAKEAERERRRQRFQQQDQAAAAAPPQAAATATASFAPSSPATASAASARPSTHRRAANSMVLSPFTLEETAVACALSDPELIDELDQQFGPGAFPDGPLRRIVEGIIDMLHSDPDADPKRDTLVSDLMTLLDDEARAELRRLIHRRLGDALYEDAPVAAEDGLFVPARPREIFAACVAERRARDAARETRAAFDRHLVTAARTDDPAGSPSDETRRLAAQHLALLRERKRGAKRTDESAGAVGGASA
ncbi:MAG: DNA primase, partial [Planctomycetota bacterium]